MMRTVGVGVLLMLLAVTATGQLGGLGGGPGGGAGGGGMDRPAEPPPPPPKAVWLGLGPVHVGPEQEIDGVVALGPVYIAGKVNGDVISIGGEVIVAETGVVSGHVTAVCGPVEVAEGAKVAGEVRRDELPELRAIDVGWPGTNTGVVHFGHTVLRAGEAASHAIIVFGGAVVERGVEAKEVLAIGGDLEIREGATVEIARAVGGQVRRPDGKPGPTDEMISPVVFDPRAAALTDAPPGVRTVLDIGQRTSTMEVAIRYSSPVHRDSAAPDGELTLDVGGRYCRAALGLTTGATTRGPLSGRLFHNEDTAEEQWDFYYDESGTPRVADVELPPQADQALLNTAAMCAGLGLETQVIDEQGRSARRWMSVGVPAQATNVRGRGYGGRDPRRGWLESIRPRD